MQKLPSVSPALSVSNDAIPEAPSDSSRLIARKIDRAGLWSCVPIVLFCGIGLALRAPEPGGQTLADSSAVAAMRAVEIKQGAPQVAVAGVLAADETMIMALRPASGYSTLRGELAPAVQVRGEAPIGGRVTQVLVRTGQKVRVGDPVMRVEGKVNAPGSKSAQRKQDAAENAQVAASKQQDALQNKLLARQARLQKAQQRVNAAQQRVALAREIVQRMARGENVTHSDVAAIATPQLSTRLAARGASSTSSAERAGNTLREAERREAAQNARQSRRKAKLALDAAELARREAEAAGKLAQTKKQAAKDAQAQIAKAEAQVAAGTLKNADVEAARTLATAAQSAAQESAAKADAAQKIAEARDADADKLRAAATFSDKKLAQLPGAETPSPTIAPAASPAPLNADEAAQLAQSAIQESAEASAEAERLKREIDSYARQVKSLHATLTNVGQNLETAQMDVVESKIAEKLEAVRAPASGVVLDVAASSREVTQGETIIAIGRPDQLEIRFEDVSNAWKSLKPGALLPAVVQSGGDAIPVMAELREITGPKTTGEAAILLTNIANPPTENRRGRRFQPGLKVTCSVPRPGTRESLSVPSTALLHDESGKDLVAVLSPLVNAVPSATDILAPTDLYHVEWRTVTAGHSDGVAREIDGGLQPGERIALRAEPLRRLTQTHGPDAVVKLNA